MIIIYEGSAEEYWQKLADIVEVRIHYKKEKRVSRYTEFRYLKI